MTLIMKTHEFSDEILFDFRFRRMKLPVFRKNWSISGSRSDRLTIHIFRVNCIHPQSFIQIGILVSEILGNTTKMNTILGGPR